MAKEIENNWDSEEGIIISLTDRDTLSYADEGGNEFVLILVGTEVYKAKVWKDGLQAGREYVIINHTVEYLDMMNHTELKEWEWDQCLDELQND